MQTPPRSCQQRCCYQGDLSAYADEILPQHQRPAERHGAQDEVRSVAGEGFPGEGLADGVQGAHVVRATQKITCTTATRGG
jgi:hypothetical protein